AWADAIDPSLITDSEIGEDRVRSSSRFAFYGQVPSQIDEELALLRGRSDRLGSVRQAPVYNRLEWSVGTGTVADALYTTNYGIERVVNQEGDRTETQETLARALYPQGHGDAWGHYLTGLSYFYDLMRQPGFDWVASAELAETDRGTARLSRSAEEEIFARLALGKVQAGARVAELAFRKSFRDDQVARLLGQPATPAERAMGWGFEDWTRRAGTGVL
ncbi:MAG: hypothetical protein KC931_27575, partial [Candidatus Omnitrophica bacterium]|nr:hypothetical protein [Candidatus Omnitrophota bacterium]